MTDINNELGIWLPLLLVFIKALVYRGVKETLIWIQICLGVSLFPAAKRNRRCREKNVERTRRLDEEGSVMLVIGAE